MHEVSLMKNLLEIVERAAGEGGVERVSVIHMKIGEMSGVSTEALEFAFEVLSGGTVAHGGRLEFEKVPFRIECRRCGRSAQLEEFIFRCQYCGSTEIDIVSGREMEIDYILAGDEDEWEGEGDDNEINSQKDGGKQCIR